MISIRFFLVYINGLLIIFIFVKINLIDYEVKFFFYGGGFYYFFSVVIFV